MAVPGCAYLPLPSDSRSVWYDEQETLGGGGGLDAVILKGFGRSDSGLSGVLPLTSILVQSPWSVLQLRVLTGLRLKGDCVVIVASKGFRVPAISTVWPFAV